MNIFQNNALFWQKVDTLYLSSDIVITQEKNSIDAKYPDVQYPLDYGYLKTLSEESDDLIPCFVGKGKKEVVAIILSANILKKNLESIVLIGTDENEEEEALRFLNQTEYQKSVILHRGHDIPGWALSE